MKPKHQPNNKIQPGQSCRALGFTVIELIVVIALMVVMSSLVLANYAGTRGKRNVKIAESQMVTNIRKTQSFVLSSRNVSGTTPAKYYGLNFVRNSAQYTIQSIDTNYAFNGAVETVTLPQGVTVTAIQDVTPAGVPVSRSSLQVAFAAPYAKLYTYNSADCSVQALSPATLVSAVKNPACLLTLADHKVIITLTDAGSQSIRTVTVYGLSGKVEGGP